MNVAQPNLARAPLTRSRATTISPPTFSSAISMPAAPASPPSSTIAAATAYGELAERVERFGHVLRSLGLRREERMLMCLLDTIDWPTAFLGAIKAGVVAGAGQHAADRGRLPLHARRQPRARLLVVSEELYPKFAKAIARAAKDLRARDRLRRERRTAIRASTICLPAPEPTP